MSDLLTLAGFEKSLTPGPKSLEELFELLLPFPADPVPDVNRSFLPSEVVRMLSKDQFTARDQADVVDLFRVAFGADVSLADTCLKEVRTRQLSEVLRELPRFAGQVLAECWQAAEERPPKAYASYARFVECTWLAVEAGAVGWRSGRLAPTVAALRFRALSAAFRADLPSSFLFDGPHPKADAAARARAARLEWVRYLSSHEQHPVLVLYGLDHVDEMERLVLRDPAQREKRGAGVAFDASEMDGRQIDLELARLEHFTGSLLYPRFLIGAANRASWQLLALRAELRGKTQIWTRLGRTGLALGVPIGLAMLSVLFFAIDFGWAGWIAVSALGAVAVLAISLGPLYANAVLLRMLAGSAIGYFAVVSLSAAWKRGRPLAEAGGLMLAGCVAFLMLSVSGYRTRPGRVAVNGLTLAAIGLGQAVTLVIAASMWLLPAATGKTIGAFGVPRWEMTFFLAAASFAAGILLQVVWDGRPITQPLTNRERRWY